MRKPFLALGAALVAVTACSGGGAERAERRVDDVQGRVNASLNRLGDRPGIRAGGSQFSDGIFVGASAQRDNAALLPSNLQAAGAIRLQSRDPMTLADIAQRLTEITGLPHILALGPTGNIQSSQDDLLTAGDVARDGMPGSDARTPARRLQAPTPAASSAVTMRPNLKGPLSEILNQVTNVFDVEWSYSDGRILLRDFVTRKYQISALPSTSSGSSTIGANEIVSTSEIGSDIWSEVEASIGGIVGEGASIAIGRTTGLVTVTARVGDQERIADYVKQLNGSIGQQISFDINVLTVTLDESDRSGLDISAAFRGSSFTSNGSSGLSSEIGGVNIGLIDGAWSVEAIVGALSRQGRVSVQTRAGATTSNNRMAPIQVIDKTAYLAEVEVDDADGENNDGRPRIRRTAAEIETGFQMQIFPRVLNNRDIMVQYTVRLSELKEIKTFGEGNEAIQLPEVSTTSFEQQAVLENGQTLVLAGFERRRAEVEDARGSRGILGYGRSNNAASSRVATVMLITPRILGR